MQNVTQVAASQGNIFASLGIDWKALILQIIAFLLLVFVLGKWVYPWLMKSVDERQAGIEAAAKATAEAQKSAEANKEAVAQLLAQARKEANEIIGTAKLESAEMVSTSEKKAQKIAERIAKDAHEQLDKDVVNARKVLYNDTLELVGLATEKIIAQKLDKKTDGELIDAVVKAAK
ncbi:MAG: atpF [Candidatus Saccharibacteria bacterium]|nr:atpF [Candidatus Saccharibacteria bacterium]